MSFFFCFKQKTSYEMRISDWSSDVCSSDLQAAYAASHLPGALYAHLDRDLSDHRKPGGGRHPWPDAADFDARLGDWGITAAHQVVAYDDGDGAFAARLWFLLRDRQSTRLNSSH